MRYLIPILCFVFSIIIPNISYAEFFGNPDFPSPKNETARFVCINGKTFLEYQNTIGYNYIQVWESTYSLTCNEKKEEKNDYKE